MNIFLRKVVLFSLGGISLFIVYAIWFFTYEPINYLNLKQKAELTYDPVWKMKDFLENPSSHIILGNSQVAHISVDSIENLGGPRFANIAFGGASLKEAIDQFWWAAEVTPLKEVWFCVSFYTFNKAYNADRIEQLKRLCASPWEYMTNKYYIALAWKHAWEGNKQVPYVYLPVEKGEIYRQDLINYANVIKDACKNYSFDDEAAAKLREIGIYCKKNNIKLIFVIPPIHQSVFDLVIKPMNLEYSLRKTLSTLIPVGIVYDWQFENDFMMNQNNFQDGFHLNEPDITTWYTQQLLLGNNSAWMKVYNEITDDKCK